MSRLQVTHRHARAVEQSLASQVNAAWPFERKLAAWGAVMQEHGLLA